MRAQADKQHQTTLVRTDEYDDRRGANGSRGEREHDGRELSLEDGRVRFVAVQRARIIAAMVDACADLGVVNATVADVVDRAGVSRRTFYEFFQDREQCFLAAMQDAVARLWRAVERAYDPSERWERRVKDALVAILAFLENEPSTARLLIVDTLAAGPAALQRREQIVSNAIAVVNEGQAASRNTPVLPAIAAEASTRAVLSIVHARVSQNDQPPKLLALTSQLMSTIVLPYLGPAAARRQLQQPPPQTATPTPPAATNPLKDLKDLNLRLTYRTVRVLNAVAANPGASNRSIGRHAGIADQGQTSKLLTRLQRLNLIANDPQTARGTPNAWTLTTNGQHVHQHTR